VQGADPIVVEEHVPRGQFCGGCSGEAGDQHGIGAELFNGMPDMIGHVRRFARTGRAKNPVLAGKRVILLADAV
jgi:hypothetical protein